MCAAVTSASPSTVSFQQMRPWPVLERATNLPLPRVFGATGVSEVLIGRPPRDQLSVCDGQTPPTGLTMSPWWPSVCARIVARFAVTMRLYGFLPLGVAWQITVFVAEVAAWALKATSVSRATTSRVPYRLMIDSASCVDLTQKVPVCSENRRRAGESLQRLYSGRPGLAPQGLRRNGG